MSAQLNSPVESDGTEFMPTLIHSHKGLSSLAWLSTSDDATGQARVEDVELDRDQQALGALGYKSEFRRDLNWWSTFGLSLSVLGVLPAFGSVFGVGLAYGGTSGQSHLSASDLTFRLQFSSTSNPADRRAAS